MAVTGGALADACGLIRFYLDGGAGMTEAGLEAMRGDVAVSPVTVWELTRKAAVGKLPSMPAIEGSFALWLGAQGFRPLPLTWADAERASLLPPIHKDPMDRMLIAQALAADLTVVTQDGLYTAYGVRTVW